MKMAAKRPAHTPHVRLVGQPEVTIFRVLTCRDLRTPVDVPATWNVRRQRPELVRAADSRWAVDVYQ